MIVAAAGRPYGDGGPGRIYSSDDGGKTWVDNSSGLEGNILALALDSSGHMYAGVMGGQIFRTNETTTTLSVPVSAWGENATMALSVSPNPVRAGRIRISMPATGDMQGEARLTVHNLLGEVVLERTVALHTGAGMTEAELEIGGVPDGSYQIVVENGGRRGVAMFVVGR
jgi:photosystem II stability/assembly factor-like uncharacterized protein